MAEGTGEGDSDHMVSKGRELWTALRNNPTGKQQVLELLRNGAKPNFRDNPQISRTPLHFVVSHKEGDLKLIDMLLEHGADTNLGDSNGWTPLHLATEKGYLKTVEKLLTNPHSPADRNKRTNGNETALNIVERILTGPRPDVADETPLGIEKARRKDLDSVASYLRYGQSADVHSNGPAPIIIIAQPDSNVTVDIDKADAVAEGDNNTITKNDKN